MWLQIVHLALIASMWSSYIQSIWDLFGVVVARPVQICLHLQKRKHGECEGENVVGLGAQNVVNKKNPGAHCLKFYGRFSKA